jgi:hypothetical protein
MINYDYRGKPVYQGSSAHPIIHPMKVNQIAFISLSTNKYDGSYVSL